MPPGRRVEADLRARIAAGEWTSGQRLPSVPELAEHYHVARGTVASALHRIEADGLIEVVPAWGTFRKLDGRAVDDPVKADLRRAARCGHCRDDTRR